MNSNEKLKQSLDGFNRDLDTFRQTSQEYAHNPEGLGSQMVAAKAFESLVESSLTMLAAKVATESGVTPQSIRDMLVEAQDLGLTDEADIWVEALDYCQKLKKSDKPEVIQEALDFSQTYFTDAIDGLAENL